MTFSFTYGGYGTSYNIEAFYRKGELFCTLREVQGLPAQKVVVVDLKLDRSKEWSDLIHFLKHCHWQAEYIELSFDGAQWELRASQGNSFRLHTRGDNAYPEDFDTFCDLLNSVLAGTGIQV